MANFTYNEILETAKKEYLDETYSTIEEAADDNLPIYTDDLIDLLKDIDVSLTFDDIGLISGLTDLESIIRARIYEQLVADLYNIIDDYDEENQDDDDDY